MTSSHLIRLASTGLLLLSALASHSTHAAIVFSDSFNRPDNRDIDGDLTGIINNTGTTFAASAVYSSPWVDPATVAPLFGVPDDVAGNGGGQQILNNELQLKYGVGTANAFVNHNFTNASILSAGGFSVTLDVLGYNQTTVGQGAAIAVGMTLAEAQAGRDANDGNPAPIGKYTNAFQDTPFASTVLSDFYVALRGNGTLAWGSGNAAPTTVPVAAKTGTITASFGVTSFNAGSTVTYEVFYNGASQGVGSFVWSDANANYIGLDGRDNTVVRVDNFSIDTAVPTPKPTLTVDRNTGNVTLKNLTNSPLSISAYSLITENGGFDQANWSKIQTQGIDVNDAWITLTAPGSTTDLAEGTLGEYTIAAANPGTTDQISLGNAWRRSPFEDIAFELRDANGNDVPTIVEYVGNGGSPYKIGDFSLNGVLDAADWVILRNNLTSSVAELQPLDRYFAGDLNNDGLVNQADFHAFKALFPASGPNSFEAVIGVPEPTGGMLFLVASAFVAWRRRRSQAAAAAMTAAVIAGVALGNRAQAADLFVDTFDRPDSLNLDASKAGISGTVGAALPVDGVYSSPWLDPAAETTGPDADAANGGGHDILANQLRLALGAGTSNAIVNHNFTDAAITAAKGFRVSLDVVAYSQTTLGQGGAFAIGMSQAEALSAGDAQGAAPNNSLTHVFGGTPNVISDFWVGLRGDNMVAWGAGNVAPTTATVAAKTGTISAEFVATSFTAGNTVAYQVFYNGVAQGHGVFKWSGTNENYIGLDARDAASVTLDNFKIETVTGLTPQSLRLQINTTTGAAALLGGGSSNSLDFYEITSPGGGLLAGGFNGIRGDAGLPAGDGSGNGWELGGANSATSLTEAYLLGSSTIASSATTLPLGTIWNVAANQRDVSFTYADANNVTQLGFVEYVTGATQSADFNGSGTVDGADFLIWQRNFGVGTTLAQGDANGDSLVNAADLAIWKSTFGQSAAAPVAASIPEPGSILLTVGALAATGVARRRIGRRS